MATLSIIVPVYNAASYLSGCIESILAQTCDDWELILVDDGSKDSSLSIALSYSNDSRIKVINQPNRGPSAARNRGLAAASGKYISFVDADDWVDSDYVKLILNHAGEADIIFWGLKKWTGEHSIAAAPKENFVDTPDSVEAVLQSLIVNHEKVPFFGFTVTKLFKKSIIDNNNITFHPDLRIKEDELFVWKYCLYVKSIKTLNCTPYNYRILRQSLSHNKNTFANYSLLARETNEATAWIQTNGLKEVACNMIFDYLTGAVLEEIRLKKTTEAKKSIKDHLLPYISQHSNSLTLPLWGKIASTLPTDTLKSIFVLAHLVHYSKRWKK